MKKIKARKGNKEYGEVGEGITILESVASKGLHQRQHLSKNLKEMKNESCTYLGQTVVQVERGACAKALRWDYAW